MSSLKEILRKYRAFPIKRLGQNFLLDKKVLKKIVKSAELSKKEIVVEIGPGIGNLTKELAKKAKKVIAIEKDKRMVEILKKELKNLDNVEIIEGDAREKIEEIAKKIGKNYKIVANIPYYLTSFLIRKILELKNKPKLIVLMVQKEVAQRICAKPPKMNLLAVSVQFFSKAKIISFVPKNCFWPRPKVDSAILEIQPKEQLPLRNLEVFFKIVKKGFSHKRKQLINNLAKGLGIEKSKVRRWLLKSQIDPKKRAEQLKIEDWINLANFYEKKFK